MTTATRTRRVCADKLQAGDRIDAGVVECVRISAGKKRPLSTRLYGERVTSGWPIPTKVVVVTIRGRRANAYFWPRQRVEVLDA